MGKSARPRFTFRFTSRCDLGSTCCTGWAGYATWTCFLLTNTGSPLTLSLSRYVFCFGKAYAGFVAFIDEICSPVDTVVPYIPGPMFGFALAGPPADADLEAFPTTALWDVSKYPPVANASCALYRGPGVSGPCASEGNFAPMEKCGALLFVEVG